MLVVPRAHGMLLLTMLLLSHCGFLSPLSETHFATLDLRAGAFQDLILFAFSRSVLTRLLLPVCLAWRFVSFLCSISEGSHSVALLLCSGDWGPSLVFFLEHLRECLWSGFCFPLVWC